MLSALLALAAIAFYVVVYTLLLKRRTPQNIVWGGAAGCMPVLIGWAAVTGSLAWTPVVLFGVIFLWTPPHYWPLSMRYRDDYAAVGRPDAAAWWPSRSGSAGRVRRLLVGDGRLLAAARAGRRDRSGVRVGAAVSRRGASCSRRTDCSPGPAPARHAARRCGCSTARSAT